MNDVVQKRSYIDGLKLCPVSSHERISDNMALVEYKYWQSWNFDKCVKTQCLALNTERALLQVNVNVALGRDRSWCEYLLF